MFWTKTFKSDTKENYKFVRKNSKELNGELDFYATNNNEQEIDNNGIILMSN